MSFLDLASELAGTLPGLSPILAQTYIKRAWKDVQDERRWSFLMVDGVVVCPVQITAGTVAIVQYTATVTLDATASAAFPPPGSTPDPTQLQIRFGGSGTNSAGQVYRIMEVDITVPAAIVLTLDRSVVEPTNPTATYQVYRCYITPPQSNFRAWEQLVDMTFGMRLKLNWTSGQFDAVDPQRTSQGDAYYCGYFRTAGPYGAANTPDPNVEQGSPIYELWPHPTSGRTFYARFIQSEWQFVNPSDTQPDLIDDELIVQRAYGWHAYPFAMANPGNFSSFKGVNWLSLILDAKGMYRKGLMDAKKKDDAQALSTVWNRGHGLRPGSGTMPFPIDAQFIQGHLLNW